MVCSKCKNDGIMNTALGKSFWYCRTCKVEIELEVITDGHDKKFLTQQEIDELFDQALWSKLSSVQNTTVDIDDINAVLVDKTSLKDF